jgi:uncharacterized protein
MKIEELIFVFFIFSFFGWIFELFLEFLAGRGFVNRGFFYGPIVPIYAAGFFFAYMLCYPLKNFPPLVFLVSSTACTLLEYIIGWCLEKYLHVEAWNYDLHPFTFWCNYKKRIAVTASITFGMASLLVVCFLWDNMLQFLSSIGSRAIIISDIIFVAIFLIDAFFTLRKYIRNKKAGIVSKTKGLDYNFEQDYAFFDNVTKDILANDKFLESENFIQHGKTSVYEHSLAVARMCAKLSVFWRVKDRTSLIRAALLHDFFLYDWHDEWKLDHGFTHPVAAAENASKYFNISEKEYSLIRTHMWPFTLFHPPRYKEGWFICIGDKIVSLSEILSDRWMALRHTLIRGF